LANLLMMPLWNARDAATATGGSSIADWSAMGVSIDSRSLASGDLFVALRGPSYDGHIFVGAALQRGAAAVMVDREISGLSTAPSLRVADTFTGLAALGSAARKRSDARIIAVTGSVGKTGTKEALRLALAACGTTFASAGGLNNHWGVPLSLARMPPEVAYGIFELGMNHSGEISGLTRLVRPHVAVITAVEPAHLGFFPSVKAIADAKAEIFLGLEPGGIAVLNRDNHHYNRLAAAAVRAGAAGVVSFGAHRAATVRLLDCVLDPGSSTIDAALPGFTLRVRLPVLGRHWAMNVLAVLAGVRAVGADPRRAAEALAGLEELPGRGRRYDLSWQGGTLLLIDESYNASPASMRAAFAVLAAVPPGVGARRVAVLGDMLELGRATERLHRELAAPLVSAGIDRVFLVGNAVGALYDALPKAKRGGLWLTADDAVGELLCFLQAGDVVTVKGSRRIGLGRIVERLRAESARREN
jgi:UDP-N-acetylmuramoyl-tripeptide--D-alanyl-D-alanine ligase